MTPPPRCPRTLAPVLAAVLALVPGACQTAPVGVLPPPLPEVLDWELPEAPPAYFGAQTEENASASLDDLSFEPGVRVTAVTDGSPAVQAGIRPGDVILAVDGEGVDDPATLELLLARAEAAVSLEVQRGDSVFAVEVLPTRAGGAVAVEHRYTLDPARSAAGWATTPTGVRLVSVADGSPFPSAGLPLGSEVLAVEGEPMRTDRELVRALRSRPEGAWVDVDARLPDGHEVRRRVHLLGRPTRITRLGVPVLFDYEASPDGRTSAWSILDLWFFQLFQYRRDGRERHWVLLEAFGFELFPFSTGVGELSP